MRLSATRARVTGGLSLTPPSPATSELWFDFADGDTTPGKIMIDGQPLELTFSTDPI